MALAATPDAPPISRLRYRALLARALRGCKRGRFVKRSRCIRSRRRNRAPRLPRRRLRTSRCDRAGSSNPSLLAPELRPRPSETGNTPRAKPRATAALSHWKASNERASTTLASNSRPRGASWRVPPRSRCVLVPRKSRARLRVHVQKAGAAPKTVTAEAQGALRRQPARWPRSRTEAYSGGARTAGWPRGRRKGGKRAGEAAEYRDERQRFRTAPERAY